MTADAETGVRSAAQRSSWWASRKTCTGLAEVPLGDVIFCTPPMMPRQAMSRP